MALIPPCEICQVIECILPSDYLANTQSFPPEPLPVIEGGVIPNNTVYLYFVCPEGYPFEYTGTAPVWIEVDYVNSRLIGLAGIFVGATLALATANAQAALDAFSDAAIESGELTCGGLVPEPPTPGPNPNPPPPPPPPPPPTPPVWSALLWGVPDIFQDFIGPVTFTPDSITGIAFAASQAINSDAVNWYVTNTGSIVSASTTNCRISGNYNLVNVGGPGTNASIEVWLNAVGTGTLLGTYLHTTVNTTEAAAYTFDFTVVPGTIFIRVVLASENNGLSVEITSTFSGSVANLP